jgi:hypothetical protein
MRLDECETLAGLTPIDQARGWSEGGVPLEQRGVSLAWLVRIPD